MNGERTPSGTPQNGRSFWPRFHREFVKTGIIPLLIPLVLCALAFIHAGAYSAVYIMGRGQTSLERFMFIGSIVEEIATFVGAFIIWKTRTGKVLMAVSAAMLLASTLFIASGGFRKRTNVTPVPYLRS